MLVRAFSIVESDDRTIPKVRNGLLLSYGHYFSNSFHQAHSCNQWSSWIGVLRKTFVRTNIMAMHLKKVVIVFKNVTTAMTFEKFT